MDQNYIDIETCIRNAQKLRSQAMGELISSGLNRFKRFLTRFQYPGTPKNMSAATPSAYIALQDLP
jgi:hypothetical protein